MWTFDMGTSDPRIALERIIEAIGSAADNELEDLGAGPLESLLIQHEEELWPAIESQARSDPRFRRALRGVWAYSTPKFDDREALLRELGEWQQITVRFVGYREDLDPESPLTEWRAIEIDGAPLEHVIGLMSDIVRSYEFGAWGRAHRDRPTDGV